MQIIPRGMEHKMENKMENEVENEMKMKSKLGCTKSYNMIMASEAPIEGRRLGKPTKNDDR